MPEPAPAPLPPPRDPSGPYRVCCVCLGNICRSPMAEVVLRGQLGRAGLAGRVVVDSAGTGDWHVGDRMERRALAQLSRAGYDGAAHRARQVDVSWLSRRDLILAMDAANLRDLRALAPPAEVFRVRLLGEVAGLGGQDVPDPYYGDAEDFEACLDLVEQCCAGVVASLQTGA